MTTVIETECTCDPVHVCKLLNRQKGDYMIRRILSYWRIRNLILTLLYQSRSRFVSRIAFKLWKYVDEVGVQIDNAHGKLWALTYLCGWEKGDLVSQPKQKVEQSALTMLGVEVDKFEISEKLFKGFDTDETLDRVRNNKPTEGMIVQELMGDESFMDELLDAFSS